MKNLDELAEERCRDYILSDYQNIDHIREKDYKTGYIQGYCEKDEKIKALIEKYGKEYLSQCRKSNDYIIGVNDQTYCILNDLKTLLNQPEKPEGSN